MPPKSPASQKDQLQETHLLHSFRPSQSSAIIYAKDSPSTTSYYHDEHPRSTRLQKEATHLEVLRENQHEYQDPMHHHRHRTDDVPRDEDRTNGPHSPTTEIILRLNDRRPSGRLVKNKRISSAIRLLLWSVHLGGVIVFAEEIERITAPGIIASHHDFFMWQAPATDRCDGSRLRPASRIS